MVSFNITGGIFQHHWWYLSTSLVVSFNITGGIFQHHWWYLSTSLVVSFNITGGIFQHHWWYLSTSLVVSFNMPVPDHTLIGLPRFYTAKQRSYFTMTSKIDRFISIRTPLEHPGSQSSSKVSSAKTSIGTKLIAKPPPTPRSKSCCLHATSLCTCDCSTKMTNRY